MNSVAINLYIHEVPLLTIVSTMPPMAFNGVVTKAGFMNKTATVTVSRWVIHKLTGKVSIS